MIDFINSSKLTYFLLTCMVGGTICHPSIHICAIMSNFDNFLKNQSLSVRFCNLRFSLIGIPYMLKKSTRSRMEI